MRRSENISERTAIHVLIKKNIEKFVDVIEQVFYQGEVGKPGIYRKCTQARLLFGNLSSDELGYITLRILLSSVLSYPHKKAYFNYLAFKIGMELEVQSLLNYMKEFNKKEYKFFMARKQKYRDRWRSLKRAYAAAVNKFKENMALSEDKRAYQPGMKEFYFWSYKDKLDTGTALLNCAVRAFDWFKIVKTRMLSSGQVLTRGGVYVIYPTEQYIDWINHYKDLAKYIKPIFMPLVIPPVPYTSLMDGGYHLSDTRNKPLITGRRAINKDNLKLMKEKEDVNGFRKLINVVNILQSKPWRINKKVLEVAKNLYESSSRDELSCFPARKITTLPLCPICGKKIADSLNRANILAGYHPCFRENKPIAYSWWANAEYIASNNFKSISNTLVYNKIFWLADFYKDDPKVYFTYSADFRGRLYSSFYILNPQGDDFAKGLLEFGEGEPIETEEELEELKIHVANMYGKDKLSIVDRLTWFNENETLILNTANDPYENVSFWSRASNPFQFLASVFEYQGFKEHGYGYMSHLSIIKDATCSGLQHYAAILCNNEIARKVNLFPSSREDAPEDIYSFVLNEALKNLKEKYGEERFNKKFQKLKEHDLLNRNLMKPVVMTIPYGASPYNLAQKIRNQLNDFLVENVISRGLNVVSAETCLWNPYKNISLSNDLAFEGYRVMKKLFPELFSTLYYLKRIGSYVGSQRSDVAWMTPSGFKVTHSYILGEQRIVMTFINNTFYYDRKKARMEYDESHEKDKSRKYYFKLSVPKRDIRDNFVSALDEQKASLAPNFIHSMDASLLWKVVNRVKDFKGLHCVHDCIGVHVKNVKKVQEVIREEFYEMYKNKDILKTFLASVRQNLIDQLTDKEMKDIKPLIIEETLKTFPKEDKLFACLEKNKSEFELTKERVIKSKYLFN